MHTEIVCWEEADSTGVTVVGVPTLDRPWGETMGGLVLAVGSRGKDAFSPRLEHLL